jgi:hypothetical protein
MNRFRVDRFMFANEQDLLRSCFSSIETMFNEDMNDTKNRRLKKKNKSGGFQSFGKLEMYSTSDIRTDVFVSFVFVLLNDLTMTLIERIST